MSTPYQPESYWSDRLQADPTLRSTGHANFSERYNDWLYRRKEDVLSEALGSLVEGSAVLDIGSGTGWVIDQLIRRGFSPEGCDIADVAVERLRALYPSVEFFKASVGTEPVPRPSESFDCVTMLDVSYHITDDEVWSEAVRDLSRVLKPGGLLVLTDQFGTATVQVADHVRMRSRSQWSQVAHDAGLEIVTLAPLFTWLSRSVAIRGWGRLPDSLRGAIEYYRDTRIRQPNPHLRWAVLRRS